MLELLEVLSYL
jgi:hypothetical protein